MLQKVLVANRGEIACRIMRTARAMGIGTVAVFSDADAKSLHVAMADEAVHLGASVVSESYLNIEKVIAAAQATGADCVHPGYGFLAENADFTDACKGAGLKFIGPSGDAMRALGGKAQAKNIAISADVPVVPGYQAEAQDLATLQDPVLRHWLPGHDQGRLWWRRSRYAARDRGSGFLGAARERPTRSAGSVC